MGQTLELTTEHLVNRQPLPQDGALSISRSQLTQLLLEAHRKSINTTEEVMCLKEIGKINGLYESKAPKVTINIAQQTQKLEVMSDEELLQLTGGNQNLFSKPQALEIIDAELVEE